MEREGGAERGRKKERMGWREIGREEEGGGDRQGREKIRQRVTEGGRDRERGRQEGYDVNLHHSTYHDIILHH